MLSGSITPSASRTGAGRPSDQYNAKVGPGSPGCKASSELDVQTQSTLAHYTRAAPKNEGGLAWSRRGLGWPNALSSLYSLFFRLLEVWRNHHTVGLLLRQHGSPHLHRHVSGLSGIPQNVESPPEAVKDGPHSDLEWMLWWGRLGVHYARWRQY